MSTRKTRRLVTAGTAAILSTALAIGGATAAGGHGKGSGHGGTLEFGQPGKEAEATRTIEIVMGDNYFEPETISITEGETVRFVVRNQGEFLHEFNIGTAARHADHQAEMMTMMEHGMLTATGINHDMMKMDHGSGMAGHAHDDANSVLVEPGKAEKLIWKFAKAMSLEFACNIPGHYDAGMMGDFRVSIKQAIK